MKKTWLILLGCMFSVSISAQILTPVKWKFTAEKVAAGVYKVHCTAVLEEGWHIYSQYTPKGGPFPTLFTFADSPGLALKGKVQEVGTMEKKWEEVFEVGTLFYHKQVDFVQEVRVDEKGPEMVRGTVEFMACTNEQCLSPEEVEFAISLDKAPR